MRQQNTKATVPLDVVPECCTERCSPRFRPEVAFGAKFQMPVARQGGREMSAARPYVTEPFVRQLDEYLLGIPTNKQQHSSNFLHVVRSSVSCGSVHLMFAKMRSCRNTLVYGS